MFLLFCRCCCRRRPLFPSFFLDEVAWFLQICLMCDFCGCLLCPANIKVGSFSGQLIFLLNLILAFWCYLWRLYDAICNINVSICAIFISCRHFCTATTTSIHSKHSKTKTKTTKSPIALNDSHISRIQLICFHWIQFAARNFDDFEFDFFCPSPHYPHSIGIYIYMPEPFGMVYSFKHFCWAFYIDSFHFAWGISIQEKRAAITPWIMCLGWCWSDYSGSFEYWLLQLIWI